MTLMFEMETKLNYAAWSDGFLRKRLLFPLRFWFWFCSSSRTVSVSRLILLLLFCDYAAVERSRSSAG